jgi:hypothetical protein
MDGKRLPGDDKAPLSCSLGTIGYRLRKRGRERLYLIVRGSHCPLLLPFDQRIWTHRAGKKLYLVFRRSPPPTPPLLLWD